MCALMTVVLLPITVVSVVLGWMESRTRPHESTARESSLIDALFPGWDDEE